MQFGCYQNNYYRYELKDLWCIISKSIIIITGAIITIIIVHGNELEYPHNSLSVHTYVFESYRMVAHLQ